MASDAGDAVEWSRDVHEADWLVARLRHGTTSSTVGNRVPDGYEAYVRIFHPIRAIDGSLHRWSAVARRNGWTPHAEMKFRAIARPRPAAANPVRLGEHDYPDGNCTPPEVLDPLLRHLGRSTTRSGECWFCVWTGYSEFSELELVERQLPHVMVMWNGHHLYRGPLDAARGVRPYTPNLWWPADRAWVVGRTIEDDSTLVAGGRDLLGTLLDDPRLEAMETVISHSPDQFHPDPINS